MNSVMDDNRLLTLPSNERIRLMPHMRMIFEIRDLNYASPATVTRAGILFISEAAQWKNYVASWIVRFSESEIGTMAAEIKAARAKKLQELFDKYMPPTMLRDQEDSSRRSCPSRRSTWRRRSASSSRGC